MSDYDYVIVGSGAGGGPLAANLARRGFTVLLLEAGGDPAADDDHGRMMYEVPIFHGLSTEYDGCSWDYFVRHYTDEARQKLDTKYVPAADGVWYPRAGTLGGCTAHNAMITVTPQAMDWDGIAKATGDWSWRAENMYRYFSRLENARYVWRPGSLGYLFNGLVWSLLAFLRRQPNSGDWSRGHGFAGWLTTTMADPRLVFPDHEILRLLWRTVRKVMKDRIGSFVTRVVTHFDPNDIRNSEDSPEGVAFTPLAVAAGKRNGPREYLHRTRAELPDNLTIQLHTLCTRVLFEGTRAVGVEVMEGKHLYEADPLAPARSKEGAATRAAGTTSAPGATTTTARPPLRQIRVRREVILACGAFNTPQILKLSGVGPADELAALGIPVVVNSPGVGENLQDRYEVAVVSEFPHKFSLFTGATFVPPATGGAEDPFFAQWKTGRGIYTSNGSLIGVLKRSSPDLPEPDLYIFGLPGDFRGYKPGYSKEVERFGDRFTWAILKAYTNNRAGRVTLRSKDPTQAPRIEFNYFSEGSDESGADLDAVVDGVQFVRAMNQELGADIKAELWPGPTVDTPEKLRTFIQNEAWGHHASCTARIGPRSDPFSVLDSRFRVRGVQNLRVVDASAFPRIPGYFIVSAVYMISEKAADVIAEDARLA